jgi:hypothetical protein
VPTPILSEKEMIKEADLVVEGRIIGVVLTKRWVADDGGARGYEQGHFKSWVLVSKVLKGPAAANDTIEVFTHAYKEGKWSKVRRFVYEGTEAGITPGNRMRFYLRWDAKLRRYQRVHYNSGYLLLERSKGKYPTMVGRPAPWPALSKEAK